MLTTPGGAFTYVSGANFFGEILEWTVRGRGYKMVRVGVGIKGR